jgi:hypothetical protein
MRPEKSLKERTEQRYADAQLLLNLLSSSLATLTWTSLCAIVVIVIWRADWSDMDSYSSGLWLFVMIMNTLVTTIAIGTSAFALRALWLVASGFVDDLSGHPNLLIAVPSAVLGTLFTWGLLFFTTSVVAVLAVPLAVSLGVMQ